MVILLLINKVIKEKTILEKKYLESQKNIKELEEEYRHKTEIEELLNY
jgi:predicted nucleic acid-binding protein